jgi:hypothetical protein
LDRNANFEIEEFVMVSQRKIDAARRNGALSRGPVTAAGLEKSSQNSRKHGITAKKLFVLANESTEAFDDLVAGINRHYQPEVELEHELCLNIAYAYWRLRRLSVVETGLFDDHMSTISDESCRGEESIRLARTFDTLANGKSLGLLTKYEARLYRTFYRLIEQLEKAKGKNEPNVAA